MCRFLAASVLLISLASGASHLIGDEPKREADLSSSVQHLTLSTTAPVGESRIIAFRTDVSNIDRQLNTSVAHEDVLAVLRVARVLSGRDLGFVRVYGKRPGVTQLFVEGQPIEIQVLEPRKLSLDASLRPQITGLADGSVIWGTTTLGVQALAPLHEEFGSCAIRVGDDTMLEPLRQSSAEMGAWQHAVFELDASTLPEGPLACTPVIHRHGDVIEGATTIVRVIRPDGRIVFEGEAEAEYEVERPQRFRDDRRTIGRHAEASEGRYFVNAGAYPAVCIALNIAEPGLYQVMIRAGGTFARGALPTVGLVVDGENVARTNGNLVSERFHRVALGVPVRLDAGRHVLTPFFENDFYVPRLADRNLWLDRIEIARVDTTSGIRELGELNSAGSTMSGSMGGMAGESGSGAMSGSGMAAMMMESGGAPVDPSDDFYHERPAALRIGFDRPLDGLSLTGMLEVSGICWWDGVDRRRAPEVTLLLNGEPFATHRTGAPLFWIDPAQTAPGLNTLQLVASHDDGSVARTPIQRMTFPSPESLERQAIRYLRFSIHDEAWSESILERLESKRYPKERRCAVFLSESSETLALPHDLTGSFRLFSYILGEHFQGPPIARFELITEGETNLIADTEAPTWWDRRQITESLELTPGPKAIRVSFINDAFEAGKGDRNLLLQSIILLENRPEEDVHAPTVAMTYPRDGQEVFGADAVVVTPWDDGVTVSAEVLIDGRQTGVTTNLLTKPGPIVLPLILRDIEPGEHAVSVRVTDARGNTSDSEPRTVTVLASAPSSPTVYGRAIRMLDRFAFGPDPVELAQILTTGEQEWLRASLAQSSDDPGDVGALGPGSTYFPNLQSDYAAARRALVHGMLTSNPARARFVLWAQNHFSTWRRKTEGDRKWQEHVTFWKLGPTHFSELLRASAQSPAMLRYLDQEDSYAGRINENYAREILELHTLGVHGGYAQEDVTRLARLLTGWTASREGDGRSGGQARTYTFRFSPALNDGASQDILGMRFERASPRERYDRVHQALELLASHPSTANYVSKKLVEHYVGVPASESLIESLAQVFLETDGDMTEMLIAMSEDPAFWDAPPRLAHPLDYLLRLCRTTGHFQPWSGGDFLERAGAGLFDRVTPDGYPEADTEYTDSNALLQRWRFADEARWALAGTVPGTWRWSVGEPEEAWMDEVIDAMAIRLTGFPLNQASHESAKEFMRTTDGGAGDRVQKVAALIAQMPEANMR